MRVITGTCKGNPLKTVAGTTTRPTTDKVKEALFNRIGPFFDGGSGLDLYAGSGALGIEALSRGMAHMTFVDKDPKALKVIHANIRNCRLEDKTRVYRNDADRALKTAVKQNMQFSVIFMDPPYFKQKLDQQLYRIAESKCMTTGGCVVVEHLENVALAETYDTLSLESAEVYGNKIMLSVYRMNG